MKRNRLEELMSAVAFAEAGEFEKAREILKRRKVLLAASERTLNDNIFKFALNICKRVDANLDILCLGKPGPELKKFASMFEKEAILCTIARRDGCMRKAILDYTERRSEILFVVVGSEPELDIECEARERALSDVWRRLRCPLVVVTKEMPSEA